MSQASRCMIIDQLAYRVMELRSRSAQRAENHRLALVLNYNGVALVSSSRAGDGLAGTGSMRVLTTSTAGLYGATLGC
jgi:hypothetical protein